MSDFFDEPDIPEVQPLPPPAEEVDVSGQKQLTKKTLKRKKGRKSTILSTRNAQGKKTVLG